MGLNRFFFFLLFLPTLANGQSVEVIKENARIEGKNASGYQVAVTGPEDEVRNSLIKYLKALGKVRTSGDYITMTESVIGGRQYTNTVYAATKQLANTTAAWIGLSSETGEASGLRRHLEKLAYDFGVAFQRERIQMQIDESLQALDAVERQLHRLANQNEDLKNRIERNKRDKIELEESLLENKLELEALKESLKANLKARDSVKIATGQIKKVVEMHKARQRHVK